MLNNRIVQTIQDKKLVLLMIIGKRHQPINTVLHVLNSLQEVLPKHYFNGCFNPQGAITANNALPAGAFKGALLLSKNRLSHKSIAFTHRSAFSLIAKLLAFTTEVIAVELD